MDLGSKEEGLLSRILFQMKVHLSLSPFVPGLVNIAFFFFAKMVLPAEGAISTIFA